MRKLKMHPKSKRMDVLAVKPSKSSLERLNEMRAREQWAEVKRMAGEG